MSELYINFVNIKFIDAKFALQMTVCSTLTPKTNKDLGFKLEI